MAAKMGRAEGLTTRLEKDEGQDCDESKEAAEEGNLKAAEPLAQQLDERAHDREQQAPGHH